MLRAAHRPLSSFRAIEPEVELFGGSIKSWEISGEQKQDIKYLSTCMFGFLGVSRGRSYQEKHCGDHYEKLVFCRGYPNHVVGHRGSSSSRCRGGTIPWYLFVRLPTQFLIGRWIDW